MITAEDLLVRLAVAAVLGGAVGFERERVEQPAGLRDHALVCVGSALIMIVSGFGFGGAVHAPNAVLDPSRVAAQVVSGIGFLGAGTIILRRNIVRGLTTAASIWVVAGVGLAVGGGLYLAAVVTTLLALIILAGAKPLERRLAAPWRRQLITVIFDRRRLSVRELRTTIAQSGVGIDRIEIRLADRPDEHRADVVMRRMRSERLLQLVDELQEHPAIHGVQSMIELSERAPERVGSDRDDERA